MMGQRGLIAGVVASLLAASGCVSCGSNGDRLARNAAPTCDVPSWQRNQVYVFALSGMNPRDVAALDGLREKLNQQGFAKIATGQTLHATWMAGAMRRIHDEEPDAVFVVVGSGSGGRSAGKLADKALEEGLPVRGVVLLDPEGKVSPAAGIRTLVVGSGYGVASSGAEAFVVPDAGRFGLPADSRTAGVLVRLLNEVAAATTAPVIEVVAEWSYPHAPPERPTIDSARSPEWAFLFDEQGGKPRPLGEAVAGTRTQPAAAPTAVRNP